MSKHKQICSPQKQRGIATMFIVVVIVIIMAVMALTVSRVGIQEQRMAGNDIRAREVHEAAQAGLEYAKAWANENTLPAIPAGQPGVTINCQPGNLDTGCPGSLTTITGSTSGENYVYSFSYFKAPESVRVTSRAWSNNDDSITATAETHIKQSPIQMFGPGATTPPPWVLAGCVTTAPTGTPDSYVLSHDGTVALSGTSADPSCMQQGHLSVSSWDDANGNGTQDPGETTGGSSFNVDTFPGCPSTNCAWNNTFTMELDDAKDMADDAGNTYGSNIPCGTPNPNEPSVYLIHNSGNINTGSITGSCSGVGVDDKTIGTPSTPVVLIVPSSYGCPSFNGGVTIYGIVYYETTTDCESQGWGGATIYGSVIWEGNIDKPNANSQFIETDYEDLGGLDDVFNIGIDYATSIPGTWKDY